MSLTDDFGHFQLNIFLSKVKRKIHVSRIFKFFTKKIAEAVVCSSTQYASHFIYSKTA